jgi:hypothetical protein
MVGRQLMKGGKTRRDVGNHRSDSREEKRLLNEDDVVQNNLCYGERGGFAVPQVYFHAS